MKFKTFAELITIIFIQLLFSENIEIENKIIVNN